MTAKLKTGYGEIISGWELTGGRITVTTKIPPNTTATIRLPKSGGKSITENGIALKLSNKDNEDLVLNYGSGEYVFEYSY